MYTQALVVPHLKDDVPGGLTLYGNSYTSNGDMVHLIDLWTLADELQMPALQNDAMTTIYALQIKTKDVYLLEHTRVYDNTAKDSALRLFFAHYLAIIQASPKSFGFFEKYLPKSMMTDIIVNMSKRLNGTTDNEFRLEDYLVEVPTTEEAI